MIPEKSQQLEKSRRWGWHVSTFLEQQEGDVAACWHKVVNDFRPTNKNQYWEAGYSLTIAWQMTLDLKDLHILYSYFAHHSKKLQDLQALKAPPNTWTWDLGKSYRVGTWTSQCLWANPEFHRKNITSAKSIRTRKLHLLDSFIWLAESPTCIRMCLASRILWCFLLFVLFLSSTNLPHFPHISAEVDCWAPTPSLSSMAWEKPCSHRIHGIGIFANEFTIQINYSCRQIYQSHGSFGVWSITSLSRHVFVFFVLWLDNGLWKIPFWYTFDKLMKTNNNPPKHVLFFFGLVM